MIGSLYVVLKVYRQLTWNEREHLREYSFRCFFEPFFIYYNIILESLKIATFTLNKDGTVTGRSIYPKFLAVNISYKGL